MYLLDIVHIRRQQFNDYLNVFYVYLKAEIRIKRDFHFVLGPLVVIVLRTLYPSVYKRAVKRTRPTIQLHHILGTEMSANGKWSEAAVSEFVLVSFDLNDKKY